MSRDTLLNIATLGMQSFKDSCYRLIAQGFTESASYSLLSEFNGLYISACLLGSLYFFQKSREASSQKKEFDEMLESSAGQESTEGSSAGTNISIEERQRKLSNLLIKLKALVWCFILLAVFIVSVKVLGSVKNSYVRSAIIHYKQITSITRPYMTEKEFQIIESKFSQIAGKTDYASVMVGLYAICDKNGIKHSTFTPW